MFTKKVSEIWITPAIYGTIFFGDEHPAIPMNRRVPRWSDLFRADLCPLGASESTGIPGRPATDWNWIGELQLIMWKHDVWEASKNGGLKAYLLCQDFDPPKKGTCFIISNVHASFSQAARNFQMRLGLDMFVLHYGSGVWLWCSMIMYNPTINPL